MYIYYTHTHNCQNIHALKKLTHTHTQITKPTHTRQVRNRNICPNVVFEKAQYEGEKNGPK